MAQIYQNSYVTLAATSSQDCDGGLFLQFEPRSEIHVLKGLDPSLKNFDIYVQKRRPHWTDQYTHLDVFLHAEFPLMTRAWAYQERLLAPRVLHFCLEELVWECNEEMACQCGSFDHPRKSKNVHADIVHNLQSQKFSPPARKFTKDSDAAEEESNSDVLIEKWNDLVSDYSKLEITYDRDRLPALAGLAERMQRLRKDKYVAGLWENDLLKSLCWWVEKREDPSPRPMMHHLPTWSWAATNEKVYFLHSFQSPTYFLCAVNEVYCLPLDDTNLKGEVAHGYLVVTGHLTDGTLEYSDDKWKLNPRLCGNGWVENYRIFHPDYDLASPGKDQITQGQKICCLTMGLRGNNLYVLVLTCVDEKRKHYKRIGNLLVSYNLTRVAQLLPQWQPIEAELQQSSLKQTRIETTMVAPSPSEQLCYLIEPDRKLLMESWNDFLKPFDKGEINDIVPYGKGHDGTYVFVKMTPARAKTIVSQGVVKTVSPISLVESRKRDFKWFLTAEDAKREKRGERHVRYFGDTITTI